MLQIKELKDKDRDKDLIGDQLMLLLKHGATIIIPALIHDAAIRMVIDIVIDNFLATIDQGTVNEKDNYSLRSISSNKLCCA